MTGTAWIATQVLRFACNGPLMKFVTIPLHALARRGANAAAHVGPAPAHTERTDQKGVNVEVGRPVEGAIGLFHRLGVD
jgi:hypothetical protein